MAKRILKHSTQALWVPVALLSLMLLPLMSKPHASLAYIFIWETGPRFRGLPVISFPPSSHMALSLSQSSASVLLFLVSAPELIKSDGAENTERLLVSQTALPPVGSCPMNKVVSSRIQRPGGCGKKWIPMFSKALNNSTTMNLSSLA